ncbi:sit4 phosphatase-associated protein [Rhypophila sp. PSN 637]
MFWRFGGYANTSAIDTILDRENFQLEDLLQESDLIQELKQHNAKLVEYLREPAVLEKLLEYVVAPRPEPPATRDDEAEGQGEVEGKGKGVALPSRPRASSSATDSEENDPEAVEKKRNRYAFVAAEILSSDNWSIYEALMESKELLQKFWQFLKRPAPLDNLQASYFTKVNESLFDKKTDDMLAFLRGLDGAVPDMLNHVDCPNIMDLLLRIISLERTESGQGIVEWLYTQNLVPTLLSFLGPEHPWSTQTSAGDFLKAIITVSANASQNEQTCIGPNELTRQLVSRPCVEQLIKYMLGGGNPLTCGVGIIIEVIRKNNSDYDPDGAEPNSLPSSRDPIYLGTLLRLFADHIPDFMDLVLNGPNQKESMITTSGQPIKPLGFDRFKTCELMAELLHCSNMGLLNEKGAEEMIAARDAHRQRLREAGRLNPMRVDDAPSSTEDLTMRMSQSSHAVERRLGVTNVSEDDGFEEVTDAPDDDSSHGVEELPEIPIPSSTSSFLEKDDDEFVEEPLSSPRLNTKDMDLKDDEEIPTFEERELAPRPSSPTKRSLEEEEDSAEESTVKGPVSVPVALGSEEFAKKTSETHQPTITEPGEKQEVEKSTTATAGASAASVLEAEDLGKVKVTVEPVKEKSHAVEGLSPHPEDTPPPLFAAQAGSVTTTAPTTTSTGSGSEAPASADPEAEISKQISDLEEKQARVAQDPTSEAAVPSSGQSFPPPPAVPSAPSADPNMSINDDDRSKEKPVVGDYLKMQFVEHSVVPTILTFFFRYQWNNFLHNVVYDIVQQVFNGPMDRGYNPVLATSLFEVADITNQIINGQLESERSEKATKTRMGYMGHLTLIAEEVVKFTERHPSEVLGEVVLEKVMAPNWVNYVEGPLAETRERDNAILGGVRPDVAMARGGMGGSGLGGAGMTGLGSIGLSGGGGSNALAEAGLSGGQDAAEGASGGIGPFAISSGTLMSGFGSSSDEEEEDEQDNDDDVASEVSYPELFIMSHMGGPSGSQTNASSMPPNLDLDDDRDDRNLNSEFDEEELALMDFLGD